MTIINHDQQMLMDEVYAAWQAEKGLSRREVFAKFSPLHRAACILGNMNYQVNNGGWHQWHDNQYSESMDDLIELCKRGVVQKVKHFDILLPILFNVKVILHDMEEAESSRDRCGCSFDDEDEGDDHEGEYEELCDKLNKYDDQFYEFDNFEDSMQQFLNRFEEEVDMSQATIKVKLDEKPRCKLVGTDGNIFAVVGNVARCLRNAGLKEQATELQNRILHEHEAKSYDEALAICQEYVDAY